MNEKEIKEILERHAKWLKGEPGGEQADLRSANLQFANLRSANLHSADLRSANLQSADLRSANLQSANLHSANLQSADLQSADLRSADLHSADLQFADLQFANLHSADLRSADLHSADLRSANLSGSKGIAVAKTYLSQFETDKKGIIVYKAIGNTYQSPPAYWTIKPSSFLEEVVNPLRTVDCGSGVNFATLDWIGKEFAGSDITVWKCRILWEDLADVVVPYNTNGKARCARLQLIEPLKEE